MVFNLKKYVKSFFLTGTQKLGWTLTYQTLKLSLFFFANSFKENSN